MNPVGSVNRFAASLEDAKARYKLHRSRDPFPQIQPALLNSADIMDYVAATGMIYPFDADHKRFKPASYRIMLLGKCVFWDEKGVKQVVDLAQGRSFRLKSNSIAYVSVDTYLQLPDYIAARFNLIINNVYRGLLLGTGPLVDPGFVGRLSIPLHNLTANDYDFRGGDPLIWMEFTKLSPNDRWLSVAQGEPETPIPHEGVYVPFPPNRHEEWDVEDYLKDAHPPDGRVQSSIPSTFEKAQSAAEKAERRLSLFNIGAIIGTITLLVAMLTTLYQVYSVYSNSSRDVKDLETSIRSISQTLDHIRVADSLRSEQIKVLQSRVDSLGQRPHGK